VETISVELSAQSCWRDPENRRVTDRRSAAPANGRFAIDLGPFRQTTNGRSHQSAGPLRPFSNH